MTWDQESIRGQYPALKDGHAYLDGAGGTQVPESVIEAVADVHRSGLSNLHGPFPASRRSATVVEDARQAVADLTGGQPDGVVLGPNMTTLTYRLAAALGATWAPGDEVVVSELDHDANIRPWVQAAAGAGATVRWARIDPHTAELPVDQYHDLVTERTRLVAVTGASNLIGTIPDVAAISAVAHASGALVYVDAVASAPHLRVDQRALGADFVALSAYKWCGPHMAAVAGIPDVLESLHPDKLEPSSDEVPWRFELGTTSFADLAGVTAAVEHLAGLVDGEGDRRQRLDRSIQALTGREESMLADTMARLRTVPGLRIIGGPRRRTGTVGFVIDGLDPAHVAAHLGAQGVNVWHGHAYAWELARALGLRETGGVVRFSLAPYTSDSDLDRLVAGVRGAGAGPAAAG